MKRTLFIAIAVMLMLSVALAGCDDQEPSTAPEAQEAILGDWEGSYSWFGSKVIIRVHFESNAAGFEATLDIPEQNLMGLALSAVDYEPPEVHFELEAFGESFDGELADDTISGEVVRNDISGSFTLERSQAGAASYPWPSTPDWLAPATPKPTVTETVVQAGDLILSGDEVLELSDVQLILQGNLVVEDEAVFRATNVILAQYQEYNKQYGIQVRDNATFELENVFIDSGGPWLNIDFMDSSQVSLKRVWGHDGNIPWYTMEQDAQVSVEESNIGITAIVNYSGDFSIKDSSVMLELTMPQEGEVELALPFGYVTDWSFPSPQASGIPYTIEVEDSWLRTSGLALAPDSNTILRDSEAVVVLFGVGWRGDEVFVELRDLWPGFVEDSEWEVDGAVLRVVNTDIVNWYPTVGGKGELHLIDCWVNEFEPWGEARAVIRHSRVSVIHANDEVEVWVYDSQVSFDVVARDQAVVHLFNTTVGGSISEDDDAAVYIDGEPFEPPLSVGSNFSLGHHGSVTDAPGEVIAGEYSIKGSYSGTDEYNEYLQTNPAHLPLTPGDSYRVTFDYLILETPDQGFETIFYSPQGGSEDQWLEGITINGQAGDAGSATLTNTLLDYQDYRAYWNVVGRGAIAIDNIVIENLTTGEIVATEDGER